MNYKKMMNWYFGIYDYMRKKVTKRSSRKNCRRRLSGKVQLNAEQKKRIESFYAPYCKITTIYHQMYYEKTGLFSEKYLPVDVFSNVIDAYFNARTEGKFIDNKCYYRAIFNGIKQPETVVYRCGGFWYNSDNQIISVDEVKRIVLNEKELFVKEATESYGGMGVKYICSESESFLEDFIGYAKSIKGDLIIPLSVPHQRA